VPVGTIWLGLIFIYFLYAFLLFFPHFSLFHDVAHGTVFNDMLLRMLAGRFDVDASLIGSEAFIRDGRTYAYFGAFPAVLRLPLLPWTGWEQTDYTQISLLLANCISVTILVFAARMVAASLPASRERNFLFWMAAVAVSLGGVHIQFLKPSIYQEPIAWGFVFAAWFVYLGLQGVIGRDGFSSRSLGLMGLAAGLALMSRVSMGIGLYAALFLLLGARALLARQDGRSRQQLIWPLLTAGVGAMAVGLVNLGRWGSPFVFADFRLYILFKYSDFSAPIFTQGMFNVWRLGHGLIYFFFPVWGFVGNDGRLILEESRKATIFATEMPPGSFLLSDSLLLLFAGFACVHVLRNWRDARTRSAIAIAAGLTVPCLMLLTAAAMTFRYRTEFYPLFCFLGLLGISVLGRRPDENGHCLTRGARLSIMAAGIVCVAGSFLGWLLYKLSLYTPVDQSFVTFYSTRLEEGMRIVLRLFGR